MTDTTDNVRDYTNTTYGIDFAKMHKALNIDEDQRPYTHELHVSRSAVDTILAMQNHVVKLEQAYGESSQRYLRAAASLGKNMAQLFNMAFGNDTSITRDGELSLFVSTQTKFVYGLIFHGERRGCMIDDCTAVINDDGTVWQYTRGQFLCDNHVPTYPLDAPTPGEWSFHS